MSPWLGAGAAASYFLTHKPRPTRRTLSGSFVNIYTTFIGHKGFMVQRLCGALRP